MLWLQDIDEISTKQLRRKGVMKKRGKFKMDIVLMNEVELEIYVTKIILDMGVPAHLKGYHYLRTAIIMSIKDMETVSSVTKLLYPEVAKRFRTTDQKVERAIRNAIEISWNRGNKESIQLLFGYSAESGQMRPTNSEYIARIADKIRLDIRSI